LHGAGFSPSPLWGEGRGEGIARRGLFSLAPVERGPGRGDCTVRFFRPRPCGERVGERGLHGAVFSPSPLWGEGRGEGIARCGLFSLTPVERGPGRGNCTVRTFLPRPCGERAGERELHGAVFSPSPLWREGRGEGIARRGLFSLALWGEGRGEGIARRELFSLALWGEGRVKGIARYGLFSLVPMGRGNCTAWTFLPRPYGEWAWERGLHGAVFSPSPLWGEGRGEGIARRGLFSLALWGEGRGEGIARRGFFSLAPVGRGSG
jgi:hypothetical protein